MFAITQNKGFHITFANGWTVSVQFGPGNYCDNRFSSAQLIGPVSPCKNAELAVFKDKGWYHPECLEYENDDVYGCVTPEQVAAVIAEVSALS